MNRRKWIVVVLIMVGCVFSGGCQDHWRFAPNESQKQAAWLTHELAREVAKEGAAVASPVAEQIVEGTKATVLYYGPPAELPEQAEFPTLAAKAQQDAIERPDPFVMADAALEIGISAAILLIGGGAGTKLVGKLAGWRKKAKTLERVVKNIEIFKQTLTTAERTEFGEAQQNEQTPEQKIVIAEIKAKDPAPIITFVAQPMPEVEEPAV